MYVEGYILCMIYKDVFGRYKFKFCCVLLLCLIYNKFLISMNFYLYLRK